MDPMELSDFMQRYFEATFAPLKQNGGLVIDLEGDSILALWKGGRSEIQLRKQACSAAVALAAAAREFKNAVGRPNLATRIGVHAGEIYLGNIGAGDHFKYGPTGDTVNTASRMEGLNKFLGTRILVSAEVIQNVDQFLVREAGTFRLKGKTHAITAYELICELKACSSDEVEACAGFADALRAFKRQEWCMAAQRFDNVIATLGEDRLSRFYIERCHAYARRSPGKKWDGVIEMDEK
jgi:adenylate cyclase